MSDQPQFPLSPQQRRRLGVMAQYPLAGFGVFFEARLSGKLEADRFQAALEATLNQFEILRTVITDDAQSIGAEGKLDFQFKDVQNDGEQAGSYINDLRAKVEQGRQTGMACALLQTGAEDFLWTGVLPATIADSHSIPLLVNAVMGNYSGNSIDIDDIFQYGDIAEWQIELLEGEEGQAGKRFWDQHVSPAPSRQLPLEASATDFKPESYSFTLDQSPTAAQLLAAWGVALQRWTREEIGTIDVVLSGRPFEELEDAIGPLATALPWTVEFDLEESFEAAIVKSQTVLDEYKDWQLFYAPAEGAKVEIGFEFVEGAKLAAPDGIEVTLSKIEHWDEAYKIKLLTHQHPNGAALTFYYNETLYSAEAIEGLAEQFELLISDAVSNPSKAAWQLDMLPEADRQKLVIDYNDTIAEYEREALIHHFIEAQATNQPDALALEFGERQISYRQLDEQANQLAHHLQSLGVKPDDLIGLSLERSPEMIVGILGILKSGAAYVPFDPKYPADRLAFMLEDTQPAAFITRSSLADHYSAYTGNTILIDSDWETIAQQPTSKPTETATSDNLVYVIYTSGSTGKPKGVVISHQNLVCTNTARMHYFDQPVDKFLLLSSFSFDSSVVGIFWTLTQGGTLLLIPESDQQDVNKLTETIASQNVSHTLTLPSLYKLILEYAQADELNSLKTVIVAGEPCPKTLIDQHLALIPDTDIHSEYGATETAVWTSGYDCRLQQIPNAPLGVPIENAQMYILDDHLQPVPTGTPGEVYFGGEGIAQGYLNRPELTSERFIPDPFSDREGARLYRSGDLARFLPNGDMEFMGRVDNQVKIRGFRVELEEIEAQLHQHTDIREAVVAVQTEDNGSKRLAAYYLTTNNAKPQTNELRDFLKINLPDFMIPAAFMRLDEFPRLPNGKVDRSALPEIEIDREDLGGEFVSPRNQAEEILASIWAEALGLESVGITDNFFELGGDSILSLHIVARAKQAGLAINPVQLFQYQTIAELALRAEESQTSQAEQGTVSGPMPLTPIQHWFFDLEPANPNHANIAVLLESAQDLDIELLTQASAELLKWHDALRAQYTKGAEGWEQTILAQAPTPKVWEVDLTDVSDLSTAILEKAQEAQTSLDIKTGHLLQLAYFKTAVGQANRLLLVAHHLTVDVISSQVLLEDLSAAYDAFKNEQALNLPAKTTSLKSWASGLVQAATSAKLQSELETFWMANLPGDYPAIPQDQTGEISGNTFANARALTVTLSPDQTQQLLTEVPKAYQTQIIESLLTPLAQTLGEWIGAVGLYLDVERHGREEIIEGADLSRTTGWFTTLTPTLLELPNDGHPGEALKAVKEQLRGTPDRGIGYSILRYLNADAGKKLAALAQPQINFNHLGTLDLVLPNQDAFALALESAGPDFAPENRRGHWIDIVTFIKDNQLHMEWTYNAQTHKAETIQGLADQTLQNLEALIAHCLAPEAGGYTPSDFPDAELSQDELDDILKQLGDV